MYKLSERLQNYFYFWLDFSFVLRCKDLDVSAYLLPYPFRPALKRQVKWNNFADFCLPSACHSWEVQRQKLFHFKALRSSIQTPVILSWMSRTDAAWPRDQNRIKTLPKDKVLPCLGYQLWTTFQISMRALSERRLSSKGQILFIRYIWVFYCI